MRVRVHVDIDAPPRRVWEHVRDLPSHAEWMEDARAIRIVTGPRSGLGTVMEVETRVGPFRATDVMEVDEWRPRRVIGVRHVGKVSGRGRFTMRRRLRGGTRFAWDEDVRFPWWLAGRAGELVAGPVLRRVWRRNLQRLKSAVEGGG